jgi:hypothetical protein
MKYSWPLGTTPHPDTDRETERWIRERETERDGEELERWI